MDADLVIDNFSPRVLENVGLTWGRDSPWYPGIRALLADMCSASITASRGRCSVKRGGAKSSERLDRRFTERHRPSNEVDLTLIDWFLTLSPWERLQASANWARLTTLRRAEREDG